MFVFVSVFLSVFVLQDNWGALKGKMFGRSLSVEPGRGKEDIRVLPEFKESKGGVGGIKGVKTRGEVKGSQKVQQATGSQQPPLERDSRKTRRSQRGQTGKGKGEKQGQYQLHRKI